MQQLFDQDGAYETPLTDLPKAFDSFPLKLIITKFHTYGVDMANC